MSAITSATAVAGLSALSGVTSVVSKLTEGSAASAADRFNADVAGQNSQIAAEQAQMQLRQQQTDAVRKLGAIKAGYGASGVTMSGSPLDVLADSYTQAQTDANTIIYNSKIKQAGYQNTQALDTAKAGYDESAGYMNAASTALLGAKDGYKAYDTVGTK